MKLARNLAVGLLFAGALMAATPAEARQHRHDSRCGHRSYQTDRYDRHNRYDYRTDRRHDYGYRDDYRYDNRSDYRYDNRYYGSGHRYRRGYAPPVRFHYHGRSRCSRAHVGIFFGF